MHKNSSPDTMKFKLTNLIWIFYKEIFPYKNIRPMITFIKEKYSEEHDALIGCEIGVAYGVNALSMLKSLSIKKLYLVDPYIPYEDDTKHDFKNGEIIAKKRLKNFGNKIVFIHKTSKDASDKIPNNLDFVYIDGNHDYKYVKNDIELYYPKLKKGGIIGGHDFSAYYGVPYAVIEFVNKHNIRLYGRGIDWWVIKKNE